MRYIGLLIILCAITGLFLPYGIGFVAKNRLLNLLEKIPSSNIATISLQHYQQGWFSSEATLLIQIPQHNISFTIKENIQHGPIVFIPNPNKTTYFWHCAIAFMQVQSDQFSMLDETILKQVGLIPHWQILFIYELNGSYSINFLLNPSTSSTKDAIQFHLLNHSYAKFNLNSTLTKITGDILLSDGNITWDKFHLQNKTVLLNLNIEKNIADMWYGDAEFSTPFLKVENEDLSFSVNDFKFLFAIYLNNSNYNLHSNFQLNKLSLDNINYGPINIGFSLFNINSAAMSQSLKEIYSQEIFNSSWLLSLSPQLLSLLNAGIQLHLKINPFVGPDGTLILKLHLKMPQTNAQTLELLRDWSSTWNVNLTFKISRTWADKLLINSYTDILEEEYAMTNQEAENKAREIVGEYLIQWITAGALIIDNEFYTINFVYKDKKFFLNNKLIPEKKPNTVEEEE